MEKYVKIGDQVWMSSNCDVDKFRNGAPIPHAKTKEEWVSAGENKQPAWCYYENDPENGQKYGKLYNWFAVNDPRGLAPEGWHVPSDKEWTELTDHFGEAQGIGRILKSSTGWMLPGNGTNESEFSALPGGFRYDDGTFAIIGISGGWWCSFDATDDSAWARIMGYKSDDVVKDYCKKNEGMSVRCIKD